MRGMATTTIVRHRGHLRFFLEFLKFDQHPSIIRTLRLDQVEAFMRQAAKTNNRFSLQHIVAAIRGFLRRQHAQGILRRPLHEQIDTPRTYRLEKLPRALPWEQVKALFRSVDCTQSDDQRDFTLLYLAARYGLRSGELVRLTLDDIDWRAGILHVQQTKSKQTLQLPLTDEAGDILTRYLKNSRPQCSFRQVFLRHKAPTGPLTNVGVYHILQKRIRDSGLEIPPVGCHALRHYADRRTMPTGTCWARLLTGLCRFRMDIGRGIVPHGSQAFEECQQSVSWLKEPRLLTALGGLGQDFLL
jgi:integrase